MMLMYMGEEEAFWVLVCLSNENCYRLRRCWLKDMPLLKLRFYQFTRLLKHFLPRLYKHFHRQGLSNPSMFGGTAWFVDIFISNQPTFETLLRIWDVFLHEGQKFVFRFALALLQREEKALLKKDFGDIIMHIADAWRVLDPDAVLKQTFKMKLTHRMLEKLEKEFTKMSPEEKDRLMF